MRTATGDGTDAAAAARRQSVARKIVLLMVAFSLLSYLNRTILGNAAAAVREEFSLSETEMGWILTSFQISYALFMIPGGLVADRFGSRTALAIMGLGSALFAGLTALVGAPTLGEPAAVIAAFALCRFGLGVFSAPLYPTCARTNGLWVPAGRRARVQGWISAGAGIGAALAPIIVYLVAQYGWRTSFWIAALATALASILWIVYVRDRPEEHPAIGGVSSAPSSQRPTPPAAASRPPTPWRELLRDRNLILLTVSYFTVGFFDYFFFYWVNYYLQTKRLLTGKESAIAAAIISLGWVLLSPAGGWLSDQLVRRFGARRGQRIVPMVCLSLSAILLCIGINTTSTVATVTVLALSFGFAGAADGPFWSAAIRIGGRHVGAYSSVMNTSCNLWGGLSPALIPKIAEYSQSRSWEIPLYLTSALLSVAVVSWLFIDASAREDGSRPV